MSGAASTSVVSAGIIPGFERSEMPRREQRNAFTVENSEADSEVDDHESHLDQINEFTYAPQLRREQDNDSVLFLLVK